MTPFVRAALGIVLGAVAPVAHGATSLSEADCRGLAGLEWAPVEGSGVQVRTAAAVSPHDDGLPAYCRVQAMIAPSTGVEIRLPLSGWNRRLLFTGCGGLCGVIYAQHMPDAQARGYAVATTDMGRRLAEGDDPREWTQDQQWRVDWQYRATHGATLLAKVVIATAYGQTGEQLKAVRKIHDGARKADGGQYYPTGYARGSERDWITNFLDAYRTRPALSGTTYPRFPLSSGDVVSGRRLYPYPAHSVYGGKGDVNDPANWIKR